ncbi:hypothetical protein Tco_1201959 [Tanacetum coccineum]|uniref:Reverse transcriptase domain-containing protein n=1 Tax=Tanacetum coccineum TaxID=301880 RepID=A0ABQ5ETC5_9ASTR
MLANALYSEFLKCKPLDFKSLRGVVGLTRWFEKMESVFSISNCTASCQVKFATCSLQTMLLMRIDKIEKYIGGLPDMIHGSVKASKPKTMQEAIEFTTELMDEKTTLPMLNVRQKEKVGAMNCKRVGPTRGDVEEAGMQMQQQQYQQNNNTATYYQSTATTAQQQKQ